MSSLKRRILSLMLCGALLFSMCATGTALEPEEGVDNQPSGNAAETQAGSGNSDWTICLYMCGSDLESGGSAASIDLMEMLRAV